MDFRETILVAVISGLFSGLLTGFVSFLLNRQQNKIEQKRREEEWKRDDKRRQEQWLLEDKRRKEDWEKENYQRQEQWEMERKLREEEYQKQKDERIAEQRLGSDREMFEGIQSTLTKETTDFLRTQDYHGSFPRREHQRLHEFRNNYKDLPENKFFDSDIEEAKQDLCKAMDEFLKAIAKYTFPVKDGIGGDNRIQVIHDDAVTRSISVEAKRSGVSEEVLTNERMKKSREQGETLNKLADQVCTIYDKFIQTARNKLNV